MQQRQWRRWKPVIVLGVSPGDSFAIPKFKRRNPVACDTFSRMFRFTNSVKAARKRGGKKVDILCMLLKTVYFSLFCSIVTLAATFLSSVTVKNVPERMLIKGKIQDTGEKTVQVLFLGLLNYILRSKACCIYNGYMLCLFFFPPKFKNKNIICFLFAYIALHSVLVKPCHTCFHSNVNYQISQ